MSFIPRRRIDGMDIATIQGVKSCNTTNAKREYCIARLDTSVGWLIGDPFYEGAC